MEQTYIWHDKYSTRTKTIHYRIDGNNCRIIDSYQFVDNDQLKEDFIRYIMDNSPAFLTGKRSVKSYIVEWKAHNILYRWGLFKKSTKDADLNVSESWIRRFGYHFLVKFFRESDAKKKYKKMMKQYKKILNVKHKDSRACPWSGGFGLEYFVEFLRFMRDYYENGYNVWAYDNCEVNEFNCPERPTRLQSLNMVIAAYEEWQACEDKYFKWVPDDPEDPFKMVTKKEEDGSYLVVDLGGHVEGLLTDHEKNLKAFQKEYAYLRKRFFELVAEYYDDWSD